MIERNRIRRYLTALSLAALLGAGIPPAAAQDRHQPAGDPGRGAGLWADNCARCHNMRDPKEFRDDQWQVIVMHMRVRAALTGQDARDMLSFLQSAN